MCAQTPPFMVSWIFVRNEGHSVVCVLCGLLITVIVLHEFAWDKNAESANANKQEKMEQHKRKYFKFVYKEAYTTWEKI